MKKLLMIAVLGLMSYPIIAHAEETTGEKIKADAKDAKRSIKKGAHRIAEKVCMKSDAKCLADKVKHRASEAKDATKDKASQIKNKVD